ncbi:MAG: hypothetical protein EOP06_23110 [Proteobacteria bacterium]|nr:MAG: hypothetical protein EOP06_23110 [Pseudomonadota bacterium]
MFYLFFLISLSLSQSLIAKAETLPLSSKTYVGVLVDDWLDKGERPINELVGKRVVKIAFVSNGTDWEKYENADEKRRWTIAYDGKNIGAIETTPRQPTGSKRAEGTFDIASSNIPERGKPSQDFSGWSGGTSRRPLIVISEPNVEDPESWRPTKLSARQKAMVWRKLPKPQQPPLSMCGKKGNGTDRPGDPFPESSLKISKAYRSVAGSVIVGASYRWPYSDCDYAPFELQTHWFRIKGAEVIEFGTGLRAVDAGDYDKDGHSEFIFFKSGYNRDGYMLYSNDFKDSVEINWSYH